ALAGGGYCDPVTTFIRTGPGRSGPIQNPYRRNTVTLSNGLGSNTEKTARAARDGSTGSFKCVEWDGNYGEVRSRTNMSTSSAKTGDEQDFLRYEPVHLSARGRRTARCESERDRRADV